MSMQDWQMPAYRFPPTAESMALPKLFPSRHQRVTAGPRSFSSEPDRCELLSLDMVRYARRFGVIKKVSLIGPHRNYLRSGAGRVSRKVVPIGYQLQRAA